MVLMSLGGMLQFKDSEDLKEISQLAGFPHLAAVFLKNKTCSFAGTEESQQELPVCDET
jgi:hypothetical protein